MKTIGRLFLLLIFCPLISFPQYFMDAAGGVTVDEALAVATTSAGTSYTTGYFTSSGNFGGTTLTSAGLTDGFISKTDAGGNFLWAHKFGGTGIDKGICITSDSLENIYIGIAFENTITIGSGTFTSFGLRDILIAKYDAAGNFLWAMQAGGSGNDNITAINAEANGNIAIAGSFTGTAAFGAITLNSTINPITLSPSADIFVAKLNSGGIVQWAKNGAAPYDDYASDVKFDHNGNVCLYIQFSDTITFDITHNNNINNAVALLRFDASGNETWFVKWVGTSTQPTSIITDEKGSLFATGNFTGTLNIFTTPFSTLNATYSNRYYILKFNSSGSLGWASSNSSDNNLSANDLVKGNDNNIYVIGEFRCRMNDYADIYGQGVFNSVGYRDVFAACYDSSGSWLWARQYGGPEDDAAYQCGINGSNQVVFAGSFEEQFNAPVNTVNGICFNVNTASPYCNDSSYAGYCVVYSSNATVGGNRDVLIASCVDPSRQPYDYYIRTGNNCIRDELSICINEILTGQSCIDTFLVCPVTYALLNVTTDYTGAISPQLIYQWSNGSTNASIVAFPGNYTVTVYTQDGCFTHTKSIFVGSQPSPLNPLITDSKGININANPTTPVTICAGDSVILSASNISPGYTYYWNVNGQNIFDDSVTISQSGTYYFTVGTPTECPKTNSIIINVIAPLPLDTFKIIVNNDFNQDDTVSSCFNNIHVSFVDSITGFCFPDVVSWSCTPYAPQSQGGFPCFSSSTTSFYPDSTGLYTITAISIIQNQCDTDTIGPVSKTVYFIKLAIPDPPLVNITGETELCPSGDTITLTCDTAPNYQWSGPGIISNDTLQSVLINLPGIYYVSSVVYSADGCPATGAANININYKPNPVVAITPTSGIICPNDSISLVCYTPGNYQWISPNGSLGVDSFIVYANQPGDYYCIVTDSTGCVLISNTVTAINYSSPTMLVTPDTIVCNGTSATLQVIAGAGSALQWQAPLAGNSPTQVVYSAGTYTCAVLSCNVTTILSATISSPSFPSTIGIGGSTTVCWGDSVQLTAPAGYSYHWFPSNDTTQMIYATLPGFYYVMMTDSLGCYGYTDSVFVFMTGQPAQPVITANSPVCEGNAIILSTTFQPGLTYSWNGPSGFSSILQNPVISNATSANNGVYTLNMLNGSCTSDTASVAVTVLLQPSAPAITTNSPVCTGDTILLGASGTGFASYEWFGPGGFTSTDQQPYISNATAVNNGTYAVIGFDGTCYSDTTFVTIQVLNPPSAPAVQGNSPLCEGDTLQLSTSASASLYFWNGPAGFTSTIAQPVIANVQLSNAGTYTLYVTVGSCISDTTTYMVNVNAQPPVPVITGNTLYCENDTIVLTTTAISNGYSWYGPSGFSATQQQFSIYPASTANSGWYQLIITDGICTSDTAAVLITVNLNPLTPVLSSNSPACEGDNLTLYTSSVGGTYFWSGPSGFSSTEQNPVIQNVSVNDAGTYSMLFDNGCQSPVAAINISINKNPTLTSISSNAPVCEGDELQLTFTATDYDSSYWSFGSTVLNGNLQLIIPNVQLNNSGYYTVNLSNVNCQYADSILAEVKACDIDIPNVFTPNDDGYNDAFEFESPLIENIKYKIFDRWGLVVYQGSSHHLNWNGKLNGSGNNVPMGTYYYIFDFAFTDKTQKRVTGYFELIR